MLKIIWYILLYMFSFLFICLDLSMTLNNTTYLTIYYLSLYFLLFISWFIFWFIITLNRSNFNCIYRASEKPEFLLKFLNESFKLWESPSYKNPIFLILYVVLFLSLLHLYLNTTLVYSWNGLDHMLLTFLYFGIWPILKWLIITFLNIYFVAIINTLKLYFFGYLVFLTLSRAIFFVKYLWGS